MRTPTTWTLTTLLLLTACGESTPPASAPTTATEVIATSSTTTPAFDSTEDYDALTKRVHVIESGGSLPSALVVHGDEAFGVVLDENHRTFIAAAHVGEGKVLHVGHETHIGGALWGTGDSGRLFLNTVSWMGGEGPLTVGYEAGLTDAASFLEAEGFSTREASFDDLSGLDVFVTTTYAEFTDSQLANAASFLDAGGGLITGGHAWWWAQSNDGVAENHPANKLLFDAGLVVTDATVDAGTDEVGSAPPSDLFHHSRALDAMVAHLEGTDPLSLADQVLAVATVDLAIDVLPLSFSAYFDRAMVFRESSAPVIPTEADPVVPAEQPIEHLVVRLDYKLAAELPPDEVTAHPGVADFPGEVAAGAQRATADVEIDGSYTARDWRYVYSGAGADVWRDTGRYAPAGELLTVTVPAEAQGQGLTVEIGVHTDTLWHLESWTRFPEITRHFDLDQASVPIASAFGGPIHVRVPDGASIGSFTLTIDGGVAMPRYVHGETSDAAWRDTERDHGAPWAELGSDKLVLVVPTEHIADLESPSELLDLWDEILDADADLSGDPTRTRAERIVVDRQISAGWMHSGYPIMGQVVATDELLDVGVLTDVGAWGPLHELGHNHQFDPWILPGTTETTCNLFSVYGSEEVLGISRDVAHSALDPDERATRIAAYLAGGADFWGEWSVWTALETYLQLQEAFGWELYEEVFADYREATSSPSTDTERIDEWVLRTSQAAGVDLGPFYLAWGFPVSSDILDEVALLPAWDEDPMNL